MGADLACGRANEYQLKAVCRSGDRLYLAIRTLVVRETTASSVIPSAVRAGGSIDLLHCESPRRVFVLGDGGARSGVTGRIPDTDNSRTDRRDGESS